MELVNANKRGNMESKEEEMRWVEGELMRCGVECTGKLEKLERREKESNSL